MALATDYQQYIALSRYAKWTEELGRRETWNETVTRYMNFWYDRGVADDIGYKKVLNSIYHLDTMPSMRCLMTAGEALDRDNVAGFNCSYLAVGGSEITFPIGAGGDSRVAAPIDWDEAMYVLLCGTGAGFSVEKEFVDKLPKVGDNNNNVLSPLMLPAYFPNVPVEELSTYDAVDQVIHIADSKYGWASGLRMLIVQLYKGNYDVKWDISRVRPQGSRLKIFGGRSSGPAPLVELFEFTKETFKKADGRKLTPLEAHDIMCKVADIVVVGGVRRSALISLSDLNDLEMREAKVGNWYNTEPQRALANNSAIYNKRPSMEQFIKEWQSLIESKSGERGIFNREASRNAALDSGRREDYLFFGTNPCSEIILRNRQFCNLSEVVVREDDDVDSLMKKVEIATILGTLQSTLTDFRYLSPTWQSNTEEEALLGVSFTGIMDNELMSGRYVEKVLGNPLPAVLDVLREHAVEVNRKLAAKLGINQSAAITCVKPSGTVSQLVDSASGIHPRYSEYYIRTVRASKSDPLAQFMIDKGFMCEDDVMKPDQNYVFSFPMKAPSGDSVMRDDISAIDQLELWKVYQEHWCEHKPSITVYVRDHEWLEVGDWVYKHFDTISGISFLPHTDHVYAQAPYQEIDEETYLDLLDKQPKNVRWSELKTYEYEDHTTGEQQLACVAGTCDLI